MVTVFGVSSGISLDLPIVVTCGSGVTACILALVWNLPCSSWIHQALAKQSLIIFFYRGSTGLEDKMFQFMMDHGQNGRHNQIPITQKLLLLLVKLTSFEKDQYKFEHLGPFSLDCQQDDIML